MAAPAPTSAPLATDRDALVPALAAAALGIALFSLMDAVMKGLSIGIGAYNAVLWRCALGAVLSGALFAARRNIWPQWTALRLHLVRSVLVAGMALSFFWALARLPIAEAIALAFIAPLITIYLAEWLLGERARGHAVAASLLGLAGVLVIVSAKFSGGDAMLRQLPAVGAVLVSAVLYAVNLVIARRQALSAGPVEIAFFQNLLVAAILALAAPWLAVVPSANWWGPLAAAAALTTASLLLMAFAYARAEAQILVSVEYTAFGWAALLGWLWFDERLVWQTVAGMVLIAAGCALAARRAA